MLKGWHERRYLLVPEVPQLTRGAQEVVMRRITTAMALAVVLALSGPPAFADGGGSGPAPKPNGASTYTGMDGVVGFLDAVSAVAILV
jgi:hypothetical protein